MRVLVFLTLAILVLSPRNLVAQTKEANHWGSTQTNIDLTKISCTYFSDPDRNASLILDFILLPKGLTMAHLDQNETLSDEGPFETRYNGLVTASEQGGKILVTGNNFKLTIPLPLAKLNQGKAESQLSVPNVNISKNIICEATED